MTVTLAAPVGAAPALARLLLVESPQLVGETLQAALAGCGFDVALSACASAPEILEEAQGHRPGVVVLDLEEPDGEPTAGDPTTGDPVRLRLWRRGRQRHPAREHGMIGTFTVAG